MSRTLRINVEAQKKSLTGMTLSLEELDAPTGKFVAIKSASVALPTDLAIKPPLDDPESPAQTLTAKRLIELAAQSPVPAEVGLYLYRLIFRGKLAAEWDRLRGESSRLILRIGREPRLALLHALPWERMHDEEGHFLALSAGKPLARWADPPPTLEASVTDWPIRLLIVHGAEPDGGTGAAQQIGADAEMHALERLLATRTLRHEVEYDVLEHPTRQQIVEACKVVRPHVLHIIGHAQSLASGGELLLWQPGVGNQPAFSDSWKAADIRLMLQEVAPRLVFLNACRSSTAGIPVAAPLPLASLTQAFLQAGSAATIGMQGEVSGDLACVFAETFYRTFLENQSLDIDAAVLKARLAMTGARVGASVVDDADWAFPVLTRSVGPAEVLPHTPSRLVAGVAERFVARLPERREAHLAIRCCKPAKGVSQHLAIIVGRKGSGKSYLSEWTVQACRRSGQGVASVAFDPQDKVDWLDALRWIRDGQRRAAGMRPMPVGPTADWPLQPHAFRLFNHGLNQRLAGLATFDLPPDPLAVIPDDGHSLSESPDRSETLTEDTIGAFCDALNIASTEGGLVLKLDQIDGVDRQSFSKVLMDGLVRPIALGALPKVRLLLVLETEQWNEHRAEFDRLALQPNVVHVPYFRSGEFERVARQLSHQWSGSMYPEVRATLRMALPAKEEPSEWGVDVLKKLTSLLQVLASMQGELA